LTTSRHSLVALALLCAASSPAAPQTTFRSSVEVVTVTVSVRDGNKVVAGLGAADFQIADNGVVQTIRRVDVDSVPVDVTLVLDTSASTEWVIDRFRKDTQQIAALLRPIDRIRVLAIDTFAHELMAMQPAGGPVILDGVPSGGLTALYDTLAASLMTPTEVDRRHLVVAMTDGIDTYSAIRPEALRLVAARADAVLHIVHARSKYSGTPTYMPHDPRYALIPYNQRHFERAIWGPLQPFMKAAYLDRDDDRLRMVAESTGGEFHGPTLFGTGTVGAFMRVYDEFRQTYLLRFTPEGVDRAGWHELKVTVPKSPKLTIRARSGYSR
jgi:hypothetical protein